MLAEDNINVSSKLSNEHGITETKIVTATCSEIRDI